MPNCQICKKPTPKGRKKYCSEHCQLMGNRKSTYAKAKEKYKYKNVGMPKTKPIRRKCIGVYCKGEKYFMSEGKHNHICPHCTNVLRNTDDLGGDYRVKTR